MSTTSGVARQLGAWLHDRTAAHGSDEGLLERFLAGDDSAFEVLVRRHGPTVLAVCRRVLGHAQDAEDAFQATFLVLARKAHTVRPRHQLPGWLVGVAYRTARQASRQAARLRAREQAAATSRPAPVGAGVDEEVAVLLEEVQRLPEAYRTVVVLCELEGKSRRQAAEQLGWPEGTVAGRLARARTQLKDRLSRRGLGDVAPARFTALVPATLVQTTLDALAEPADRLPAAVASLAEEVSRMMWMNRIKHGLIALLATCLAGAGLAAGALGMEEGTAPPPTVASNLRAFAASTAVEPPKEKAPAAQLPATPAPEQVLASVSADGRFLAVGRQRSYAEPVTVQQADGQAVTSYRLRQQMHRHVYPLKDVSAHDTEGKKIEAQPLRKRLAREIPVLASLDGKPVDPLHLRLIKPGTVILVLPLPRTTATATPAPATPVPPLAPLAPPAPPPTAPVLAPPPIAPTTPATPVPPPQAPLAPPASPAAPMVAPPPPVPTTPATPPQAPPPPPSDTPRRP